MSSSFPTGRRANSSHRPGASCCRYELQHTSELPLGLHARHSSRVGLLAEAAMEGRAMAKVKLTLGLALLASVIVGGQETAEIAENQKPAEAKRPLAGDRSDRGTLAVCRAFAGWCPDAGIAAGPPARCGNDEASAGPYRAGRPLCRGRDGSPG